MIVPTTLPSARQRRAGRRDGRPFELQTLEDPVDVPQRVEPGDGLLPEVAALHEVDRRASRPTSCGQVLGVTSCPEERRPRLDPEGLERRLVTSTGTPASSEAALGPASAASIGPIRVRPGPAGRRFADDPDRDLEPARPEPMAQSSSSGGSSSPRRYEDLGRRARQVELEGLRRTSSIATSSKTPYFLRCGRSDSSGRARSGAGSSPLRSQAA